MPTAPNLEQIDIDYSMFNIPISNKYLYKKKMYQKVYKFIQSLRWRAFWYLKNKDNSDTSNTNSHDYSNIFPTRNSAPECDLLKPFENALYLLIKSIEFRSCYSPFQKKLIHDVKTINKSNRLVIFSDKTRNLYFIDKKEYKQILQENITAKYRKTDDNYINEINKEALSIIKEIKVSGKVKKIQNNSAFLTVKDHKTEFPNKVECRLINPIKSDLGKISKKILDKINLCIKKKTKLVQWKNSYEVVNWFKNINNKENKKFLKFDIVSFYPSITYTELEKALKFANQHTEITDREVKIIKHTCMSVLSDADGLNWTKNGNETFDVAMGSYMGAEICDLIGLFILNDLSKILVNNSYGLYRDDGLAILENKSQCEQERITKQIRKIFKEHGFKITIEKDMFRTDFLDVCLCLRSNTFRPYKKNNSNIMYINNQSNHPKVIRKTINPMVNHRLSKLSSSKEIYELNKKPYDNALSQSGYEKLKGYNVSTQTKRNKRYRKRKITYFNPPFDNSVKTKIGKEFLKLVKLHFHKDNELRKIFNKGTVKISYSCMPNIKSIINAHNHKLLRPNNAEKTCNCKEKQLCPFNGECLSKGVYKATIINGNETKEYFGSTGVSFKKRYTQHKYSFKSLNSNQTTLSNYVRKNNSSDLKIFWSIISKASNVTPKKPEQCTICNLERMAIAEANRVKCLNKRNELATVCPHFKSSYFKL